MDYEKLYKEALERAKNCLKDGTITNTVKSYIEEIFNEFRESEDERVRRELLEYLNERRVIERLTDTRVKDEWINWLEKQGEQKSTWSEEDERIFDSIIEDVMPYGECPDYPTDEEREYFYEGNRKVKWLKSLKERVQPQLVKNK